MGSNQQPLDSKSNALPTELRTSLMSLHAPSRNLKIEKERKREEREKKRGKKKKKEKKNLLKREFNEEAVIQIPIIGKFCISDWNKAKKKKMLSFH